MTGLILPAVAALAWRRLTDIDGHVGERDADVALLQLQGIFSPLVMSTIDQLAGPMARLAYAVGEVILSKGEEGDRFIVIEEGTVDIVDEGAVIAVLGPGDGFGEMALLRDVPRTTSAIARSPVRARSLDRHAFLSGVRGERRAQEAAEQLVEERLLADRQRRSPGPTAR